MAEGWIGLALGLGILAAFTPCAFAVNGLLLAYVHGEPRRRRLTTLAQFAAVRAIFLALLGALLSLVAGRSGLITHRYQQFIDLLLIGLGILFIVNLYRPLPWPALTPGRWLENRRGITLGLGMLVGLDVPTCASPLFFALLGRTIFQGDLATGTGSLLMFGLGMTLPVLGAAASDRLHRSLQQVARRRRVLLSWVGGLILILTGLLELPAAPPAIPALGLGEVVRQAAGIVLLWAGLVTLLLILAGAIWRYSRRRTARQSPYVEE